MNKNKGILNTYFITHILKQDSLQSMSNEQLLNSVRYRIFLIVIYYKDQNIWSYLILRVMSIAFGFAL